MELHSYCKHRKVLKKWTIEQNRKLVEARIAYDDWFKNKPSSLAPWRRMLTAANLNELNMFSVRKQWSNILARYKHYKQTHMGNNISTEDIDAELIKRINQEWEFFGPIHKFMTRKTTNLHSYALSHRTDSSHEEKQETTGQELPVQSSTVEEQELYDETNKVERKLLLNETVTINFPKDCIKENIPNNNKTIVVVKSTNVPQDNDTQLLSVEASEEFPVHTESIRIIEAAKKRKRAEDESRNFVRNTDHDFYSKKSCLGLTATNKVNCREENQLDGHRSSYFADVSAVSSAGSSNIAVDLLQVDKPTEVSSPLNVTNLNESNNQSMEIKHEKITEINCLDVKEEVLDQEFHNDMPSTSTQNNLTQNVANPQRASTSSRQSEREKYYRHKRHFNRRMEKRFDAVLRVMFEVVKSEYPAVNITPTINIINTLAASVSNTLSTDTETDEVDD